MKVSLPADYHDHDSCPKTHARKMTARKVIPLNTGWQFKEAEKPDSKYLDVSQFPTNVHLDLLHHKLIPDPYIGKNELEVQWVGETAWVYRTTFPTPKAVYSAGVGGVKAVIAFDGLDTFATVVLNGKTILETDNMFTPERVDVTDALVKDEGAENEMVISFDSAYLRGWKLVEKYPDHKWGVWNGDISRLAVRKTQYHWVSADFKRNQNEAEPSMLTGAHRDGTGVRHCSPAVPGDPSTSRSTSLTSQTSTPASTLIPRSTPQRSLHMQPLKEKLVL